MRDAFKKYYDLTKKFLGGLTTQKKVLLGVSGLLIIVSSISGVIWLNQDPYQILYSDLQAEEVQSITRKLSELSIPYQLSDGQTTVFVPSSLLASARMSLAKEGLPGQDVVGFEKFDSSTLGMSSYVQRINYKRAVEGELTRSIQRLHPVKRARVHISMPPKKTFLEEEELPKASVIIEMKSNLKLSKSEVNGIAHLVASAVEGLKVAQVTIVDTRGNFLHQPEDSTHSGVSHALLELQRGIEHDYERRIEALLIPVVGVGKVNAKVTAEIDPSRVNTTEETFDPDKAVAKTVTKNDEVSSGARPNPIGIPGSRANLPGTELQNPPIPTANYSTEKNTQNNSYMYPRKIQTIDKPSGTIKRLTVSVIVDGHYIKETGKPEVFSPRTEEELKRLQDIVGNAIGFDSQRRDSITVSCLPFKSSDIRDVEELPLGLWNTPELLNQLLKNGLIALVIISFFFIVLRPFIRWIAQRELNSELTQLPRTVAEIEASMEEGGTPEKIGLSTLIGEEEPLAKKEVGDLKKRIDDTLSNSPRKGFRIVQEWIDEDNATPTRAEAA